jgi:hypothetical protein
MPAYTNYYQIGSDTAGGLEAVSDILETIAGELPLHNIYLRLYESSYIDLIRKPLVDMHKLIIQFGIKALNKLCHSRTRKWVDLLEYMLKDSFLMHDQEL